MFTHQVFSFVALAAIATALPVTSTGQPQYAQTRQYPVKQLWQGEKGSWLENLAVRSNGNIIGTRLDVPQLYEFSAPDYSTPRLVAEFPDVLGVTGIVETEPDVFAVLPGNFSTKAITSQPGSWSVWSVDFRSATGYGSHTNSTPVTKKLAALSPIGLANGIGYLPEANSVLVSDSATGNIFRVGLKNGAVEVAVNNTLLKPDPSEGINGLKLNEVVGADGKKQLTLFFDNSNTGVVGSIPIDPKTGKAVGEAKVIGTVDKSIFPSNATPALRDYNDDIILSPNQRSVYVTGAKANVIFEFDLATGEQRVVAGNLNSTKVAEPTAVAFGRRPTDRNTLYAVTIGGLGAPINGSVIVGAQLLAIDLSN